jgi:CBS domain containing-hemolysin-like protein
MTLVLLLCVMACVLAGGFFSGAETALVSVAKPLLHTLAQQGERRARTAMRLLDKPARMLATTLVGTNVMYVTATSLASLLVGRWVPGRWHNVATTLMMTPTILIFAELLPKSLGRGNARAFTLWAATPLYYAQMLMQPLILAVSTLSSAALRLAGIKERTHRASVTREEVQTLADISAEEGVIGKTEYKMIQRVFALNRRTLSAAMVPLVDLTCVPVSLSLAEAMATAERHPHTQFPVYEDRLDNIVGVMHVLDLLHAHASCAAGEADTRTVFELVDRNVPFMPETKPVGHMLRELQTQRVPIVLVVDEYGGVLGMVTLRDLIEEIVGDLVVEREDAPPQMIEHLGTLECDGRLNLDSVADRFGVKLPKEGYDTVAGLVLKLAGRIPGVGERFEHGGLSFTVARGTRKRIMRVVVARVQQQRS